MSAKQRVVFPAVRVVAVAMVCGVLAGCGGKKDSVKEISSESDILGTWNYQTVAEGKPFEREIRLRRSGGFGNTSGGGPFQEKSTNAWRAGEWHIEETESTDEAGEKLAVKELVMDFAWVRNQITGEELDIARAGVEERYRVQVSGDGEELLLTNSTGQALAFRKVVERKVFGDAEAPPPPEEGAAEPEPGAKS